MKLSRLFVRLLTFAVIVILSACGSDSSEDPTPDPDSGSDTETPTAVVQKVWFDKEDSTSFDVNDNDEQIAITLYRDNDAERLSIKLYSEIDANYAYIFNIPTYATFAQGSTTATITVTLKPSLLEENEPYEFKLSFEPTSDIAVPDEQTNAVEIAVTRTLWSYVGVCRFRGGDVYTSMWGETSESIANTETEVEVYENKSKPGLYKFIKPWPELLVKALGFGSIEAAENKGFVFSDEDFILDCSSPSECYAEMQSMGIDDQFYNDGPYYIRSRYQPSEAAFRDYEPGKLINGVITFPAQGLVVWLPNVAQNTLWLTALLGKFRIQLPNSICALSVDYGGANIDSTTPKVLLNVDYGQDTESLYYTVVSGDASSTAASVAEKIANGTQSTILSTAVDGSGTANIPVSLGTKGQYTFVVVPKNKQGQMLSSLYASYTFYYSGVTSSTKECQCALYVGLVSELAPSYSSKYSDSTSFAVYITGTDIIDLKRYSKDTYIVNNYTATGKPLSQLVEEAGSAVDISTLASLNSNGYFSFFKTNLSPSTSYTVAINATNVFGNSVCLSATIVTAASTGTSAKRSKPEVFYKIEE